VLADLSGINSNAKSFNELAQAIRLAASLAEGTAGKHSPMINPNKSSAPMILHANAPHVAVFIRNNTTNEESTNTIRLNNAYPRKKGIAWLGKYSTAALSPVIKRMPKPISNNKSNQPVADLRFR
jgi:hypothetical protein